MSRAVRPCYTDTPRFGFLLVPTPASGPDVIVPNSPVASPEEVAVLAQLADAFNRRSREALRVALALAPDAYGCSLLSVHGTKGRGRGRTLLPLAHLAISLPWIAALEDLAAAGDRFEFTAQNSGLTPLGHAVSGNNQVAVRRLLGLGASPDDSKSAQPAMALVPARIFDTDGSAPGSRSRALQMFDLLLKAGAAPWAQVNFNNKPMTLPEVCLTWGRTDLAAYLVRRAPAPESLREEGPARQQFQAAWLANLVKLDRYAQNELFAALADAGLMVSLEALISHLPSTQEASSSLLGGAPGTSERDIALDMVGLHLIRFPEDNVSPAHLDMIVELGQPELHALLVNRWLDQGTAPAPVARQSGPRL